MELLRIEIAKKMLVRYEGVMKEEELGSRTISKYLADINGWIEHMPNDIDKSDVYDYKSFLINTYCISTVRSKLIAINRYLRWMGYNYLKVKLPEMQKKDSVEVVLSRAEYYKMINCAKESGNNKMYYILKSIATTGIRIGELQYFTVESLEQGKTIVYNKGKSRIVYIPESLCYGLKIYCHENEIYSGIIFCGRNKNIAITPCAVWKNMKVLADKAGISPNKAFPHSLRHMFAKEYMKTVGDVTELSSILGHSQLETTMIYTKTTAEEKRQALEKLGF